MDPRRSKGRWRLRNWRLRTRLLAVLLIPMLAVVVLVGLRVRSDLQRAGDFTEGARAARVDTVAANVVHELQRERDLTVRYVAEGRQDGLEELRDQQERADAAIGSFEREFVELEPDLSADAVDTFQRQVDRLGALASLRNAGERSGPASEIQDSYSELISSLLDLGDQAVSNSTDDELARTRLAASALAKVKNQMSVKRALVAEALVTGTLSGERERALLAAEAERSAAHKDFMKFATPDQQRMYGAAVGGAVVDAADRIVAAVLASTTDEERLTTLDPREWDTSATYTVDLAKLVQDALHAQLQERSDTLAADGRRSAITDAGIVVGVLLVATALAVLIARSLLKPLRVLRRTALDVAEHRLPAAVQGILADPDPRPESPNFRGVAPVPVFSREELGQVARAFDAVHGQAVKLAGEQALLRENVNSMFVNLSRRSQDLVERQLSVLDRMEEHEQDPDILSGLFELDHLATRMRRNSENLLVLAGQDAGRPLPGAVPADEVVGAALSEVEHYPRIKIAATPRLSVRGEVVGDLVHVISELFENATAYSGKESPVSVVSSVTQDEEWRIDIIDRGAGMPDAEIKRTNARLAEPPAVDVEVSRRMGLYVVARLAQRHGIRVWLSSADIRGMTATVVVPTGLIEFGDPAPVQAEAPAARGEGAAPDGLDELDALDELDELEGYARPAEPRELPGVGGSVFDEQPPAADFVDDEEAESGADAWFWPEVPQWPTQDDNEQFSLADDAPTDRMPAYEAVLSQWFKEGEEPRAEDVEWPTEDDEVPAADPVAPAAPVGSIAPVGPVAAAGSVAPAGPAAAHDPEVRSRIAGFQDGMDRGRHARVD
ncbi:nitrate- and nitrite sensing domain-containing protein [Saccharomonospora sp. NPDC006951]